MKVVVVKVIVFDVSKRETHHPGNGFKKLARRLKSGYKLQINKDELSEESLRGVNLIVFGSPRERFLQEEFEAVKSYLRSGGSAVFLLGEGGEERLGTNVNYLLEEYGMTVHKDSVLWKKRSKPGSSSGSGQRLGSASSNHSGGGSHASSISAAASGGGGVDDAGAVPSGDAGHGGLTFVYPYGATMTVQSPAHPVLSSGPISYPLNRPVAGVWERPMDVPPGRKAGGDGAGGRRGLGGGSMGSSGGRAPRPEDHESEAAPASEPAVRKGPGRLLVVASSDIFADPWLDKEENAKLCDVFMRWLLGEVGVRLPRRREYGVSESRRVPNTESLADRLRCCLQESESLPKNFTKLFNDSLFGFDTKMIPETVEAFSLLGVKHEPLTLIPPAFECPLPQLSAAVFPPIMREPPPPALDRFDLDEHFASDRIRLAQITNKDKSTRGVPGNLRKLAATLNRDTAEVESGGTCVVSRMLDAFLLAMHTRRRTPRPGLRPTQCTPSDLEYYVRECGEIMGVTGELSEDSPASNGPMGVLDHVFKRLIRFKMLNQEEGAMDALPRGVGEFSGVSGMGAQNAPAGAGAPPASATSTPSERGSILRGQPQRQDSTGSGSLLSGGGGSGSGNGGWGGAGGAGSESKHGGGERLSSSSKGGAGGYPAKSEGGGTSDYKLPPGGKNLISSTAA
ncbi:unnamed protein product [Ectocarpus sp. CCAP 1310/34]|nr:unnamed protein product [Ectocarpus sp. CCAP 1310/34]